MYEVEYSKQALKSLKKLDKTTAMLILGWISKNLEKTDNPRFQGKALAGNKKDYWRYRVGQYRIIVDIEDKKLKIIVIGVGHRKDIYK